MAENAVQRRLAAILAADVVGYSKLMGQDETGTLGALSKLRTELVDPRISEHRGRIFKTTGDGLLAEFPSVVNAVACAVDIQRDMAARNTELPDERIILLRIGVNLGDVIIENEDVFGDGVNVAARLEGIAKPGGIAISGNVLENVGNRLGFKFDDMGEQALKNIERPVRIYSVQISSQASVQQPKLILPSKPSIAVLPFINMSGDAEQEYFADGIVEDIITALSRFDALFVIARNSSFTYKNCAVDVRKVGRELGVRYVLEGSVRKAGNRVRITGQLIDTTNGTHLWADRFDGLLDDIFDLQDRVTSSVVGSIAPKLEQAEIERSKKKPTESLDAYDYYLRGMECVHRFTKQANADALANFYRAIELDPQFAAAYGNAANCYVQRVAGGWAAARADEIVETARLSRRAAELAKDDAVALCTGGFGLALVVGDLESGGVLIDRALSLNPNLAWAWLFSSWVEIFRSEPRIAIDRAEHAMRLSPRDPAMFSLQAVTALAHFYADHLDDALSWAEGAIRAKPNFLIAICVASASAAILGKSGEAKKAMEQLLLFHPSLRISNIKELMPHQRPEQQIKMAEGLRKAGLPE